MLAVWTAAVTMADDARPARPPPTSATAFLSPELRAEQADDLRNRGLLWVEQGAGLWREPTGPDGRSCASCHGPAETAMRGVAARLPAADPTIGALVDLAGHITRCRTVRQGLPPAGHDSPPMLALTAYVAVQSRGLPLAIPTDPATRAGVAAGRRLWFERQGQLNLACSQCHDDHVGRKLRGDSISGAVPTGYPAYRLEWDGLGSLHRRLRACQLGVRAEQSPAGAPDLLALEAYLADRARGLPLEAPAIRR
jgi:sulfur-oxidizing protein SoxA